jgi:hypothetical protein
LRVKKLGYLNVNKERARGKNTKKGYIYLLKFGRGDMLKTMEMAAAAGECCRRTLGCRGRREKGHCRGENAHTSACEAAFSAQRGKKRKRTSGT